MYCPKLMFLTKYNVSQAYGGPEGGGWYYDTGVPEWKFSIPIPTLFSDELAYKIARYFNRKEIKRREEENRYEYTSVLSYLDDFYFYGFSDTFIAKSYPEYTPHYE